ncbi:PREDICTED: uncharacterized protein LOC109585328, partial [Amphimedon queenslandica]|uniref:Uncharacterized protein n=1 Tax=Amphimedon queenslandica TaxID=400682 RepID=A0AAN0JIV9_AMPQE
MCLVPAFFHHLDSNNGVLEMVSVATNDTNIGSVINHIAWRIQNNGGDVWDLYHEIATYLLQATTTNVFSKRHHNRSLTVHQKQTSHSSPVKSASSQIFQVPRRSSSPVPPPRRVSSAGPSVPTGRRQRTALQPELGDKVLCAPERMARIVALPEPHVAVLQLTEVKGISGGPPDSYFYTDPRGLVWDSRLGHWSKDELGSDLSVGRLHTDPHECYSSMIIRSPSPETRTTGYTRPSSQISYLSEDLQTIPSVEELSLVDDDTVIQEEEDEQVAVSSEVPMKVDISRGERERRREGGRE